MPPMKNPAGPPRVFDRAIPRLSCLNQPPVLPDCTLPATLYNRNSANGPVTFYGADLKECRRHPHSRIVASGERPVVVSEKRN